MKVVKGAGQTVRAGAVAQVQSFGRFACRHAIAVQKRVHGLPRRALDFLQVSRFRHAEQDSLRISALAELQEMNRHRLRIGCVRQGRGQAMGVSATDDGNLWSTSRAMRWPPFGFLTRRRRVPAAAQSPCLRIWTRSPRPVPDDIDSWRTGLRHRAAANAQNVCPAKANLFFGRRAFVDVARAGDRR